MTSSNFSAVATAFQGIDEASLEALVSSESRNLSTKSSTKHRVSSSHEHSELHEPGQDNGTPRANLSLQAQSIIIDDHPTVDGTTATKVRSRRASDGAYLTKTDGKPVSGELRCEKCGKGYKHSSCLTKHLLVSLGPLRILSHPLRLAPTSREWRGVIHTSPCQEVY